MAGTALIELLEIFPDVGLKAAPEAPVQVPEEILAEARAEADGIVADARVAAQAILNDAAVNAETLCDTARREGHSAGMLQARQEVEAELRVEADTHRETLRADLQEIVDSIGEGRRQLWESQESEMMEFVLEISRQVIKTEVQQNPEVLMEILRNAMRRITDKENIRLRVCVSDAARVKAAREDVMQIVDGIRSLEIVDDRRIAPGGCVIETNAGTIDAKIETQMGEIERVLAESELG